MQTRKIIFKNISVNLTTNALATLQLMMLKHGLLTVKKFPLTTQLF